MKTRTIRTIGFGIIFIAWGFAMFTMGSFAGYPAVLDLLFFVFILGMFSVLGMSLMEATDKEERAFYRKRRAREQKVKEEIENAKKKAKAA